MAEHVQVYNPTSGKPYATAPTPKNSDGTINTSDNSNKIATTEWVKKLTDGTTTDIVDGEIVVKDVAIGGDTSDLARNRGQIGDCYTITPSIDFNTLFKAGRYWFSNAVLAASSNKPPTTVGGFCDVLGEESTNNYTKQIYHEFSRPVIYIREYKGSYSRWSETWTKIITEKNLATSSTPGIVKPGTGLSVDNSGVIGVDGTVVRTTGTQKAFTYTPVVQTGSPAIHLVNTDITKGTASADNEYGSLYLYDKNGADKANAIAGVYGCANKNGNIDAALRAYKPESGSSVFSEIAISYPASGYPYSTAPTPKNSDGTINTTDNSNKIATTEWVRSYTNTYIAPIGSLIPSLATGISGYLLCNGAVISRTTYADLFALLGTTFGEGNGSNTFNLPDFRNKTLWGANGNLKSVLNAGLPNITGSLSIGALCYEATGSIIRKTSGTQRSTTDTTSNSAGFTLNASKSSSIYGSSTTVQPPAIAVNIFIKY